MFETAIVISIFVLAMVILFAVTKDRWAWKKIIKVLMILVVGCIAVLWGGLYTYSKIENRPKKQLEYLGVKLTDSMNDVKFKKGKCTEPYDVKDAHNTNWIYDLGNSQDIKDNFSVIMWRNNKIRAIACSSSKDRTYICSDINNLRLGDYTNVMIEKLGNDFEMAVSEDGTRRCYSYKKLNSFYMLEEDKIFTMGIYNTDFGNIKFKD